MAQGAAEQSHLSARLAFVDYIVQVFAMEAGDVEIGIPHLQLLQNVVPNLARRAGGEGRYRQPGKARTQAAELAVIRSKFVTPLGNAMGLIYRKETDRYFA